jgi:hypothetical protein
MVNLLQNKAVTRELHEQLCHQNFITASNVLKHWLLDANAGLEEEKTMET